MKLRLRQLLINLILLPLVLASVVITTPQKASAVTGADWKPGRIIDDSIFFNKDSMTIAQIQAFLNAKVPVCAKNHSDYSPTYPGPYTCLKDYQENTITRESNVGRYNADGTPYQVPGGKSAAQIIWEEAQFYRINPQTLLVMLQKEQSLVTDDWPLVIQYQKAMGQSCPDTAPCDPAFAGFYRQVSGAAWQMRHYINNPTWFNYRAGVTRFVLYNPNTACGGTNVFIENNATAVLYNYTPYQPNAGALSNLYGTAACGAYGNRNFWRLFNDWFGSTREPTDYSCAPNGANVAGASTGISVMSNKLGAGPELLTLGVPNNTSSGCVELHIWTDNLQQWLRHTATNRPSINPADSKLILADADGNGKDEAYLVEYRNTTSGLIEIHGWEYSYQRWFSHIATNRPSIDPTNGEVIAADMNGDGKDEFYLVEYDNTNSGSVEVHGWAPGYQQWVSHIAASHSSIASTSARVIAADTNGDKKDEMFLVIYNNNGSGMIEVHGWAPGLKQWTKHVATNHPSLPQTDGLVISSDTNGDSIDEFILIRLANTGSGVIEAHGWTPNFQQWFMHIAATP